MRQDQENISSASFWTLDRFSGDPSCLQHAPFCFWLIDTLRPKCIFAIGKGQEGFHAVTRHAVGRLGLDTACFTIGVDARDEHTEPDDQDVSNRGEPEAPLFAALRGSDRDILSTFGHRQIDLFFVDASEGHENARTSFGVWRDRLTDDSVVLFHGTNDRASDAACSLFHHLRHHHPSFEFVHGRGLGVVCPGRDVPEPIRALMAGDESALQSTRLAYTRLGEALEERQRLGDLAARVEALRESILDLHRPDLDLVSGTAPAKVRRLETDPTILHVEKVRAAERDVVLSLDATIRRLEAALGETRDAEAAAKREIQDLGRTIDLMRQLLRGRDRTIERLHRLEEGSRRLLRVKEDLRRLLARKQRREKEAELARFRQDVQLRRLITVSRRQVATLRRSWAEERQVRLSLERQINDTQRGLFERLGARVRSITRRHPPVLQETLAVLGEESLSLLGMVEGTGLFDAAYYTDRNPDIARRVHPALHYARTGWREGRRPNADFDPTDYLERHTAVTAQGHDPLVHFADHGIDEALARLMPGDAVGEDRAFPGSAGDRHMEIATIRASGRFDPSFYRSRNPDVVADEAYLLVHYVDTGWRELRDPSEEFDTAFYLSQNPDVVAAEINPLVHFIEVGLQEGRMPKAPAPAASGWPLPTSGYSAEDLIAAKAVAETELFDADFYRTAYADLLADGRHPVVDFAVRGWRQGRKPAASFDTMFYLAHNEDVANSGENPLVHYADGGAMEGRLPIPEADPAYYDRKEDEHLAQDVQESGLFNETFYGVHNPDIVERGLDPALHFATWGWTEGRKPHPEFDTRYYLETNPDVAALVLNPLLHYARQGVYEGRRPAAQRAADGPTHGDYARWIAANDVLTDDDRRAIRAREAQFSRRPSICLLMPIHNADLILLRRAIGSVQAQLYSHWQLCIADDASSDPRAVTLVTEIAAADPRIKLVVRERTGDVSASSDSALRSATGDFVAVLDHKDELPPHALFVIADALHRDPDYDLIFSDEDRIDRDNRRLMPHFKTEYNPELALGQDFVGRLAVFRRSVLVGIGGFRLGYEGAQDYDAALRFVDAIDRRRILHIPEVLYHRRILPGDMTPVQDVLGRAVAAARTAIKDHLDRKGQIGHVVAHPLNPSWHRVIRTRPDPAPLVSIIVPTRDRVELLLPCCRGILERTDYPNIELIVVDHQSTDPAAVAYLSGLTRDDRVRVMRYEGVFNYSAMNNAAAREAKGSLLALINNDVEVIGSDWLDEMVALACLPEIGAVGAKLLYPDDRVQHGGIVLGVDGVAGHSFHLFGRDDPGPGGRAVLTTAVSAVTGACLVLRKDVYDRVGGLDERTLTIAFNDIDLCLKVRQLGLRNVLAAQAVLYHHESISRGHDNTTERVARFQKELAFMQEKWGDELRSDPYYNPNWNAHLADFSLVFPP